MRAIVRALIERPLAANLLMLVLLVGGAVALRGLTTEVFPEIALDTVLVTVRYPGAAPEEVESGVVRPIEDGVLGVDGVREVRAYAREGRGQVIVTAMEGTDVNLLTQDVKAAVDRIQTFPADAERPVVRKVLNRRTVLKVVLSGDVGFRTLRERAEALRDRLLREDGITQVEVSGAPTPEIVIELDQPALRRYGLTLPRVARAIRGASVDLPAGVIEQRRSEIVVRTEEKGYDARAYRRIVVVAAPNGALVRLGDIARVEDRLRDTDEQARFGGDPAALVEVYRVGDQDPRELSRRVREIVEEQRERLPALTFAIWDDRSEMLAARFSLLQKNAALGLTLVILVLGLFLRPRLAFWVTLGIPISMLGGALIASAFDITLNMISLFAFILVLGIVVDDAIVVGENVFVLRARGLSGPEAALRGTAEVAKPVIFAVLTTMAAFAPLMMVQGVLGKFLYAIPVIVIAVLLVSLVESLLILPAHLAHSHDDDQGDGDGDDGDVGDDSPSEDRRDGDEGSSSRWWQRLRLGRLSRGVDAALDRLISGPFARLLRGALRYRGATVCAALALLAVVFTLVATGRVQQSFLPDLEGDVARAQLQMPYGSSAALTRERLRRLERGARRAGAVLAKRWGETDPVVAILRLSGSTLKRSPDAGGAEAAGGHLGAVAVQLRPAGARRITARAFLQRWRKEVGTLVGAEQLDYSAEVADPGKAIAIRLSHPDLAVLERAADELEQQLAGFPGVFEVADSQSRGKREIELRLRPSARALGLTAAELARQVRGALFGAEALRLQRSGNEVKVMVRLPERRRQQLASLRELRIRSADGQQLALADAAYLDEGRGFATIQRVDRRRALVVSAQVDKSEGNATTIYEQVFAKTLPQLASRYSGLAYGREGEQKERARSLASLGRGFAFAMLLIYVLLALASGSYMQPLVVMAAVPFGLVGAVAGHALFGYRISLISLFGIVALSGVLVNDALVLVDLINRKRREDSRRPLLELVVEASRARFRPVLLTTLTTFFALVPMLAETSVQARFLIPMAISLAFGVLVATAITLLLVPALYLLVVDAQRRARAVARWFGFRSAHDAPAERRAPQ